MSSRQKPVAIVTGASSGIGLGITLALLEHGYGVVGTSRTISKSKELKALADLLLIDGDISKKETANDSTVAKPGSRLRELGLVFPEALDFGDQVATGSPTAIDHVLESSARHSSAPITETFPVSKVNDAIEHLRARKARCCPALANDQG